MDAEWKDAHKHTHAHAPASKNAKEHLAEVSPVIAGEMQACKKKKGMELVWK